MRKIWENRFLMFGKRNSLLILGRRPKIVPMEHHLSPLPQPGHFNFLRPFLLCSPDFSAILESSRKEAKVPLEEEEEEEENGEERTEGEEAEEEEEERRIAEQGEEGITLQRDEFTVSEILHM